MVYKSCDTTISSLIITKPPPLHPSWLAHIPSLPTPSISTDPSIRKQIYRQNCLAQNTHLLATTLSHLSHNLIITDSTIDAIHSHDPPRKIPTRLYHPASQPEISKSDASTDPLIIYYHGGGLQVGDLDSEDLTCRNLALSLSIPLISISYRLLPEHTADDAVSDAVDAFDSLSTSYPNRKFILVGSSSGGQLAATVALRDKAMISRRVGNQTGNILGVMLRCPVTCDATNEGKSVPEEWKETHTSMRSEFETGILNKPAVTDENRTKQFPMPLELLASIPRSDNDLGKVGGSGNGLKGMTWFIQLCTNDIYYSDGMCLGVGLKNRGADVKISVEVGWPHTFWLKGMGLDEAVLAERKIVDGMIWVLEENGRGEENEWVEWSG